MKTKRDARSPQERLQMGTAVLAAAQLTDVTAIKPRMTGFGKNHRNYVAVHGTVEAAMADLRKGRTELKRSLAAQEAAVEGVAGTLVAEGAPRANPFEAYSASTPSAITQTPAAAQAKTIRLLVEAVHDSKTAGAATRRAAQTAEQAVEAVEAARANLVQLKAALRLARAARTEVGHGWDEALASLKRGAEAAADEGAPGLHEALLGGLRRPKTKKATAAPAASKAAPAPAAATPPVPTA